jgi:uncharacterized protein YuzE
MTKNPKKKGIQHTAMINVRWKTAPVVELDSAARAAYIRLSQEKVAKTIPINTDGCIVTMDLDEDGDAVGIELVGVDDFGITALAHKVGLPKVPESLARRTSYISAPAYASSR